MEDRIPVRIWLRLTWFAPALLVAALPLLAGRPTWVYWTFPLNLALTSLAYWLATRDLSTTLED